MLTGGSLQTVGLELLLVGLWRAFIRDATIDDGMK
jgi:hypothetical protein